MTERLGTTGLSERTISEYVDNILPTITSDEQVNDGFYGMHTKILKSLEGNLNHDVASKVNAFKSEWERTILNLPNRSRLTHLRKTPIWSFMKPL